MNDGPTAAETEAETEAESGADPQLSVERIGPEAAAEVLAIVAEAFARRPPLDPPADALFETEESIAAMLAGFGGLLVRQGGRPVGALVMDPVADSLYLRRVGVHPEHQGHGVAHLMAEAAERIAEETGGIEDLKVLAREELPRTVRFWERLGFVRAGWHPPSLELSRPLTPVAHAVTVADGEQMQRFGRRLAARLRPGDLVILGGGLGAGKTTLTQGIADGLGVRGPVTSPTFVIARVHRSLAEGPALVHVDAYRLSSIDELDDLDLDADLDEVVTVVEWGESMAEVLAESRLEIHIDREPDLDDDPNETADPRRVAVLGVGPRWRGTDWKEWPA